MRSFLALLALCPAVTLSAASAQSLPAGTYFLGPTLEATGNCNWLTAPSIAGSLTYPGVGAKGTEIDLALTDSSYQSAVLRGFPAVPAGGLNGWTKTSPAIVDAISYNFVNQRTNMPNQSVSFALIKIGAHAAQGTLTVASATCTATVPLDIFRSGAVH